MQWGNEPRYKMFQKATKDLPNLPPTHDMLVKHIYRAHHQRKFWYLSAVPQPEIESPVGSGWQVGEAGKFQPVLMTEDPVPNAFIDIVSSKCRDCGTTKCSCRSKHLRCTGACGCCGECQNPINCESEESEE